MAHADQPRWSEARVARELTRWFAERAFDQWPPYREFVRDGRKRLHASLMRCGGPQRWALELRVPLIEHPGGGGLSEREIRQALRALLREHRPARFPGPAWLERHGLPRLAAGVRRTGGGERWAAELGVPPPSPVAEPRRVSRCRRDGCAEGRLQGARQQVVGTAPRAVDHRPAPAAWWPPRRERGLKG